MDTIPERPVIDYANLPYLPREGVQGGSGNKENKGKFLTKSLFLETAEEHMKIKAMWTLAEHEVYAYGKWYPSAWMAYIYATDEYDALRKICGNVRQWERLKALRHPKDFSVLLEAWMAEQAYIQKSKLKAALEVKALEGGTGYTAAAKIVLEMIDGKNPVGRPKTRRSRKAKEASVENPVDDLNRVLQQMGK